MISGSPPTDRNARTGLFTPPTSTFSARSKISRERLRSRFNRGGAVLMFSRLNLSRLQPACDILCGISKNGNVVEMVFIQCFTNGPHPPVHHVRRGHDVGAGARM